MTPQDLYAKSSSKAAPETRGRVLVIEPDHLTLWSIATFLQSWFTVETTNCGVEAEKLLRDHAVVAIVISDQLPQRTAEGLIELARSHGPEVRTIVMGTGDASPDATPCCATRIEKPFELAALARLLGIAQA